MALIKSFKARYSLSQQMPALWISRLLQQIPIIATALFVELIIGLLLPIYTSTIQVAIISCGIYGTVFSIFIFTQSRIYDENLSLKNVRLIYLFNTLIAFMQLSLLIGTSVTVRYKTQSFVKNHSTIDKDVVLMRLGAVDSAYLMLLKAIILHPVQSGFLIKARAGIVSDNKKNPFVTEDFFNSYATSGFSSSYDGLLFHPRLEEISRFAVKNGDSAALILQNIANELPGSYSDSPFFSTISNSAAERFIARLKGGDIASIRIAAQRKWYEYGVSSNVNFEQHHLLPQDGGKITYDLFYSLQDHIVAITQNFEPYNILKTEKINIIFFVFIVLFSPNLLIMFSTKTQIRLRFAQIPTAIVGVIVYWVLSMLSVNTFNNNYSLLYPERAIMIKSSVMITLLLITYFFLNTKYKKKKNSFKNIYAVSVVATQYSLIFFCFAFGIALFGKPEDSYLLVGEYFMLSTLIGFIFVKQYHELRYLPVHSINS